MAKLYNIAAMTVGSTGTGTITLGSAARINGVLYLSFAGAGVTDGETISYSINDVNNSEIGTGVYTAAGTTLTRNVTKSTNADAAINMTAAAIVRITPRKQDIANLLEDNTFSGTNTFGLMTLTADVTMTQTTHTYKMDTADAADNKRFVFAGGGAAGVDRGGHIYCHGNEFSSNPGCIILNNGSGAATFFATIGTTASAANAFLDSGANNSLLRSTSSLRYKKDVEPVSDAAAGAILGLSPIWYRSKAPADNPEWSWYGLGAEDVAAIEPRLVNWSYLEEDLIEDQVEEAVFDGEGKPIVDAEGSPVTRMVLVGTRSPRAGAVKVPDGVQYDRLSVLLLALVKKLDARVSELEQAITTNKKKA